MSVSTYDTLLLSIRGTDMCTQIRSMAELGGVCLVTRTPLIVIIRMSITASTLKKITASVVRARLLPCNMFSSKCNADN